MRRLILLLALLLCAPAAFAQGPPQPPTATSFPAWITPPTFINGAGVASGPILLPDGTAAAPSLTFASQTSLGIYKGATSRLSFGVGTNEVFAITSNGPVMTANGPSFTFPNGTILTDDAANTLALRNGTNAQTFNVYRTYTDGSNFALGFLGWSGNTFVIGRNAVGASTGDVTITGGTASGVNFAVNNSNTAIWSINSTGNFLDQGSHTITAGSNISTGGVYQVGGNGFGSSTIGPSSVSGTTSTAALVMAGLGGSFTTRSGRFSICMSGNLDNTTVNDGSKVQISFGTTVPTPTLNAPLQGTQVGPIQQLSQAALPAATITPFGACWVVTGQTKNTTFWTDVAYGALTGGTAVLSQASVIAYDIP